MIYNGVTVPVDTPPPCLDWPVVTMVGRLHRDKGVDLFIRSIERIPDVRARLVTHGADHVDLQDLLASSPARDRICISTEGISETALRESTLVMVPSRLEGLGLVALEAMALARPVVATKVDGLPEVVEHGVTGLLVAPGSADKLAAATRELLSDPGRMNAMGQAGRNRVREQFTLSRMCDTYHRLYYEVLDDSGSNGAYTQNHGDNDR